MSTALGQSLDPSANGGAPGAFMGWIKANGRISAALVVSLTVLVVLVIGKQAFADNFPFDFAYFHAAGRTWAAGEDPYGPAYARFALPYIPNEAALWVYPPQWWSITVALSMLGIKQAAIVWKCISLAVLTAGSALLFDVFKPGLSRRWLATATMFAIVLASSDAAWIPLHIGQTSSFMLFGFALVLHGLRFQGEKRIGAGLFLLLLKPQFGLFFLLLLLSTREGRRPAAAALALTILACLPILASFGIGGTIESAARFLSGLSAYDGLSWNRPGSLTGLAYAAAVLGLPAQSPIIWVGMAWMLSLHLWRDQAEPDAVRRFLIGLAAFYALVPLHNYDLILMPVFLLILPELAAWAGVCIALALLGTWRLGSLAFAAYGEQVSSWLPGVYLASLIQAGVGTVAVFLVLAAIAFGRLPKPVQACA